eukprot:TRINITY_DN3837_c0_g2_i5.p1 TRINITY_DN3837_c0_g2~~TRINITY_DN3837_c0_g2_i5.p1  ORF type:complete len:158 (-),score=6.44 TRINITY_DN3837_c0_g2_i5:54-527(-)
MFIENGKLRVRSEIGENSENDVRHVLETRHFTCLVGIQCSLLFEMARRVGRPRGVLPPPAGAVVFGEGNEESPYRDEDLPSVEIQRRWPEAAAWLEQAVRIVGLEGRMEDCLLLQIGRSNLPNDSNIYAAYCAFARMCGTTTRSRSGVITRRGIQGR